ncbi:MAG: NUDIX domain-containing protein [Kiritimatiellae bacterium]|jgi:8-oxo-dGTP diphosphatase|nr:NUDIX domain-containing protein [Kiritimatiellia bacterium]
MNHRISAGAFVLKDDRILLVRHKKEGSYDFWVAPGGGVVGTELLCSAAEREVKEETGLDVEAIRPVYLEEFYDPHTRHMKTWFVCELKGGAISTDADEAVREHIVEAGFFSREEIQAEQKDVFPELLHEEFWNDLQDGFSVFRHINLREMAYY